VLADRPLARIVAGCSALGAVVLLAAVPVYVWVEPSWRAFVARLAAAFVVGVALLQLRRALVEQLEAGGDSGLDAARDRRAAEPAVPYHFLDLVGDLRAAARSRRYFDTVLWPRLEALAGRPLVRPPLRWGRGPSLAALRRVIADIEAQP
jgi:hypothetical protein